jgi:DNA-binding MarR family transcriptional regulator
MASSKLPGGGIRDVPRAATSTEVSPADRRAHESPRTIRALTIQELVDAEPIQWLVPDMIPLGGLCALYGAPKCGKTFVAIDLALSVATSKPWCGRSTHGVDVLYLAAEGGRGLMPRIQAWCERAAVDLSETQRIRVIPAAIPFLDAAAAFALAACVRERTPGLIIVDTLARSIEGGDENTSKDMGAFVATCDGLREASGATVIVVHHTGREKKSPRGSNALDGAVDTLISVQRAENRVTLRCEAQRDAEPFDAVELRLDPFLVTHPRTAAKSTSLAIVWNGSRLHEPSTIPEPERLILAAIANAQSPEARCMSALESTTTIPRASIPRHVNKLRERGLVNSPSGQRPRMAELTDAGREFVSRLVPPQPGRRAETRGAPAARLIVSAPLEGPTNETKAPGRQTKSMAKPSRGKKQLQTRSTSPLGSRTAAVPPTGNQGTRRGPRNERAQRARAGTSPERREGGSS